jgi:hypothetical protein
MRELRFVMLTEDGERIVVETADGDERFTLPLSAALRVAVEAATPRPMAPPAPPAEPTADEPVISPREIQVRVRAGAAPQDVANEYGLSLERVMRFAGPVLDERARIADEARRARARRGTDSGDSRLVLFGEAVDERFRAHGIEADSVRWDARRRDDGEWLVIASWLGGESTHAAEWLFSRTSRTVTALDETAADLLSDRPIRPVVPAQPDRPALSVAPPLVPGIVAFPPMPDAATGPVPVVEEVFDQEAPPEGPRDIPPLVPAAAAIDYDEPPLPLGLGEAGERPRPGLRNLGVSRREESDEERAARARVPSWDDILLGIKRRD